MIATMVKSILASSLRTQGEKELRKDKNNVGADDASGHAKIAIAEAIDAIDLSTATKQTFKNMAAGFRAAADELDKAGEEFDD